MTQAQNMTDLLINLYFLIFINTIQVLITTWFVLRFLSAQIKKWPVFISVLLFFILSLLESTVRFAGAPPLFSAIRILLLAALGRFLSGCPSIPALLSGFLAEAVILLSNCLLSPATYITIASLADPFPIAAAVLGYAGPYLTFIIELTTYRFIIKHFQWNELVPDRYGLLFFLPVLFLLLIEQYFIHQVYGDVIVIEESRMVYPVVDHWQVLLVQLFAYFSFFSTLYGCKKLSESFSSRTRLALLEQEAAAQKEYLREAGIRYEQTKAFRHDIRNHLAAVNGLLERGDVAAAQKYLSGLEAISDSLSFPCRTGNAVVDILLGSKLGAARHKGISVECALKIPVPCSIDSVDLCVLFSNALDNAVNAAGGLEEERQKYIQISGKKRGAFFLIEIENSCRKDSEFHKGTGFMNMESVAEKYHGAVTGELGDGYFRLSILLIISRCPDDISVSTH